MGNERNSSPQRKADCNKYLGSKENRTNASTYQPIQSFASDSNSSDPKLDQDQSKILGGIEKATAKNNKKSKNGNPSNCSPVLGEVLELVQKNSNVQDSKIEQEQTETPKKKRQSKSWEFGDRYVKRGRPGPDFGPPIVTTQDPKSKKHLTGGPTPLNRLKNDDKERSSHKNVRFGTFKATEGRTKPNDVLNKRWQLDSSYSNRTIIELDKGSKRAETQDTDQLELLRTGISRNKSLNHPVLELWKVDHLVRIRKRSRYKLGKISSDERFLDPSKSKKHILGSKLEKKYVTSSNYENPNPVEDEIDLADSKDTAGSSFAKNNKEADHSELSPNKSRLSHSRFFNLRKQPKSSCLNSPENTQPLGDESGLSCASVAHQKTASSIRQGIDKNRSNTDIEDSDLLLNQDESLDEISEAHYDSDLKKKNSTHSIKCDMNYCQSSRSLDDCGRSAIVQSSNDDAHEISKDCSSLASLKYSKRHKGKGNSVAIFSVVQVFCISKLWLLPSREKFSERCKIWTLHLDQKEKSLDIFDERNEPVPGLKLGRVNSIQGSTTHGKMLINKPITAQNVAGTHRICLELGSPEESFSLVRKLKKYDPNVEINFKEHRYFEKVFDRTLGLLRSAAKRPRSNKLKSYSCSPTAETEHSNPIGTKINQRNCNALTEVNSLAQVCQSTGQRGIAKSMTTRSQQTPTNERIKSSPLSSKIILSQTSSGDDDMKDLLSLEPSCTGSSNAKSKSNDFSRSPTSEPERWTRSNPTWIDQWHSSIVYPSVGKNKATVDRADIDRLDEGEFINDNLMMFYLRWLQQRMENECPQIAKRIYFHNTFFYERLTNVGKGKTGINYENVERWTSKVNIFEYDYIVVPVNESFHWYVAIICNAPKLLDKAEITCVKSKSPKEVQNIESNIQECTSSNKSFRQSSPDLSPRQLTGLEVNKEVEKLSPANENEDFYDFGSDPVLLQESDVEIGSVASSAKRLKKKSKLPSTVSRKNSVSEPRIITLDSFGHSHSITCTNLKKYLLREIESKLKMVVTDPGHLGKTAKNIPQQDNFFDCGLFVLGYIEIFLKDPDAFIFDLLQNRFPAEIKWQTPSEMRANIRTLLFKLQSENIELAQRLKKEKLKNDSGAKICNSSMTATPSSSHQLKCKKESSRSLALNPSNQHLCKTTKQEKEGIEEIDEKEEREKKVMRLVKNNNMENTSHNNKVPATEKYPPVDVEKKEYHTENTRLGTKIFNINQTNIESHNHLIISESSPTQFTTSAQTIKVGLKSVRTRDLQNNHETHSLQGRRYSIMPHQHNGHNCPASKICRSSSDNLLKEDSMVASRENDLTHLSSMTKSEGHDLHHEDHLKDDSQSSPNSSSPDFSHHRSPSFDESAVISTASKLSKSPLLASPRSQSNCDNFSQKNLDIIKGKHRGEAKECCHRKRCKLSSSSWKRDGVEEAILKSISKSSIKTAKGHTSNSLCKNSSVIVIE